MTSDLISTGAEHDAPSRLAAIARRGLLRCAVPLAQGGDGAPVDELVSRIRELAGRDMGSARIAWAQRIVIEALVHSPNVALREHLLPDLLSGALAGALSWRQDLTLASARSLVQAQPLERGWHLNGQFDDVPNLQWEGYVIVCPVRFNAQVGQPPRWAWVALRSEEDGLHHVIDVARPLDVATASGTVRLNNVYFREDELLADDPHRLALHLQLLDQAVRPAMLAAALSRPALAYKKYEV
jgi:alkylation response protein AidB-like acyl-CoA dehydrogenase